jgi:L-fuculose-phosphate aldolase
MMQPRLTTTLVSNREIDTRTIMSIIPSVRVPAASNIPGGGKISPAEKGLALNLAFASRILSLDGQDDFNQGQVSARLSGSVNLVIKQAICGFCEATPEEMLSAPLDPLAPAHPMVPPELPLHQAIYEARPDVNAIVHTHAPNTLVFGATDWDIEPISHDGACFQGRLTRFTGTSHTVLNIRTGREVAQALGDFAAVLLRNHGAVVVGRTIKEATVLAVVLERACRIQLLARSIGAAYHVSSPKDVELKQEFIFSPIAIRAFWDFCNRRIGQQWEDTKSWHSPN